MTTPAYTDSQIAALIECACEAYEDEMQTAGCVTDLTRARLESAVAWLEAAMVIETARYAPNDGHPSC